MGAQHTCFPKTTLWRSAGVTGLSVCLQCLSQGNESQHIIHSYKCCFCLLIWHPYFLNHFGTYHLSSTHPKYPAMPRGCTETYRMHTLPARPALPYMLSWRCGSLAVARAGSPGCRQAASTELGCCSEMWQLLLRAWELGLQSSP